MKILYVVTRIKMIQFIYLLSHDKASHIYPHEFIHYSRYLNLLVTVPIRHTLVLATLPFWFLYGTRKLTFYQHTSAANFRSGSIGGNDKTSLLVEMTKDPFWWT